MTSTHSTLRVNRTFYQIVTPMLYRNISLLADIKDSITFETVLNRLFLPHAGQIEALYIWGGPSSAQDPGAWEDYLVNFLQECVNLTTLGIWFDTSYIDHWWVKLQDTVLSLVTEGKLTSLGLYSFDAFIGLDPFYNEYNARSLLGAIANSEIARARLKSLDLALSGSLPEAEMLLQSSFPNLESLTIQRTLRTWPLLPRLQLWKQSNSLTRLQIYGCGAIISSDIPRLVQLLSALQELLVSNLWGSEFESFHELYPVGWRDLPNALCNTHQPLERIYIEELNSQQIQFIGVVPTKVLNVTGILPRTLLSGLQADLALYPGMQVLRREDTALWGMWSDGIICEDALKKWCKPRNVEVVLLKNRRK
jgi:hypothetical protein